MEDDLDFIADDRYFTPEYFEWIRSMTEEEFAKHIEELKKEDERNAQLRKERQEKR